MRSNKTLLRTCLFTHPPQSTNNFPKKTQNYRNCVLRLLLRFSWIIFLQWSLQVHSKAMVERKRQMLKSKQKVKWKLLLLVLVCHKYGYFFQLVKMLMVVVTVYTLCYFPLNIVWVSLYLIIFLNKTFSKIPTAYTRGLGIPNRE